MKRISIRKIPTNIKNQALVKKRRQQIFEAVIKLFPIKGYHSTTLREISKASNITLGNLYDYISTKEDILRIIQEKATEAVYEAIAKSQDEALDPVERLKKLISSEFHAMNEYRDLILIIYQESHVMGKEILYSLLGNERRHIELFERPIKEGIKKGVFEPTNVRMLANMIKMLIDTWVIKRWDLKAKVSTGEMEKGILDIVFNGICKRST
jgi:AcrR family transcriptional regulator